MSTRKDLFINYAMSFLGIPYIWGGNNRAGLDCSGFACEVLSSFGFLKGDFTAQGIYGLLDKKKWPDSLLEAPGIHYPGSLLFFGKSEHAITHIAIAISQTEMIEAGGGDSKTLTKEDAIKRNACIRIRPISSRRDLVAGIKLPLEDK